MRLKTELLPFQVPAVEKLLPLRVGALFMEMGLGKSRTTIEMVARRREKISRVIWFCPSAVMETIHAEIETHVDVTDHPVYAFCKRTREGQIPSAFWYIVSIESMSLSGRALLAVRELIDKATFVIVDESSYIKGHDSERTRWITDLSAKSLYRLILNGTPISQGVVDLFAQYRFLSPDILGYRSFHKFAANHLEYSDRYPGLIVRSLNVDHIAAKIAPYTYQVTKEECLNLPPKLYQSCYLRMTAEQAERYQQAKEELLLDLPFEDFTSMTIFRLFTALQQIVAGFWNRRIPSGEVGSGNVEHLELSSHRVETLLDAVTKIPPQEPVVIWGKYIHDIDVIGAALRSIYGSHNVTEFTGRNAQQRDAELQRFRDGARFFLATQGSGGHGLTMVEACHAIFFTDQFKYSHRLQAEDRIHRYGQTRTVTYWNITCRGTIDERIAQALAAKGNAVEIFRREVNRVKHSTGAAKALLKEL